jgi:hypothetical protein
MTYQVLIEPNIVSKFTKLLYNQDKTKTIYDKANLSEKSRIYRDMYLYYYDVYLN